MDWETFVLTYLQKNGVGFESHRKAILARVKADPGFEPMKDQWKNLAEPDVLRASVLLNVRTITVEWIDECLPKAFFRPMFVDD